VQNMLAYTIQGSITPGIPPLIAIGQGSTQAKIKPNAPADNSYWFVFLDANNPVNKVAEFVVPATNNTSVPPDVDQYMTNPAYLFAVVTQFITTFDLPQGDLYDYLVSHGAGRQLQRFEQILTTVGCGTFGPMSYILTGQGGPPTSASPAYEASDTSTAAVLLMSLMPLPNGNPPYSICDSYTFVTRPQAAHA
jgi:hypothetical protein